MDFHSMPRKQLQALCKKNKIPANITTVAMADALKALQVVEGMKEFQDPAEAAPQPTQKAEEPKPAVPPPQPTSRRQASRRNATTDSEDSVATEEPPSSPLQQTPVPAGRRGARVSRAVSKKNPKEAAAESLDGIPLIEIPDTPATAAAKQKSRRGAKTRVQLVEPEADDEQEEEQPVEEEEAEEEVPPPRTGRRGPTKAAASPAKKKTTRRGAKARAETKKPEVEDEPVEEEPEEEQVDLPPSTPAVPAPRTGRRTSTRAASTVKQSEQKPEMHLASEQQAELDRPRRATRRTGASSETTTVTAAPSRTRGVRKMVDLLPDPDKQEQDVVSTQEEKEEDTAGVTTQSSAEDSDATLQAEEEQREVSDAAPVPPRGRRATRTAVREPTQQQEEPEAKPSTRRRQTSRPPVIEGIVSTRRSRSRDVTEPEKHEQEVVSTEEEVAANVRTRRSTSRGVPEPEKHEHEVAPTEQVDGNVRTRRSRSRGVPSKLEKHEQEVISTEVVAVDEKEVASSDSVVAHESVEEVEQHVDLPPPTTGRRNKRRQSVMPVAVSTTAASRSSRSKAKVVQTMVDSVPDIDNNKQETAPVVEEEGALATEAERPADANSSELVAESEEILVEEVIPTMDTEIETFSALSPVAEVEEDTIFEEPMVEEDKIIEEPMVEEDKIIEEPMVEEDKIIEEPMVEEDKIVEETIVEEDKIIEEAIVEESVETKEDKIDFVPEECVAVVEEQADEQFVDEMMVDEADEVVACGMQEECVDVPEKEADATVTSPVNILEEEGIELIAESGLEIDNPEIEVAQNEEQKTPSTPTEEKETDLAVAYDQVVAADDVAALVDAPLVVDQAVEEQVLPPSTPATAVSALVTAVSAAKMSASVGKSAASTVKLSSGSQRLLLTPEVMGAPNEEWVSKMDSLCASEETQVEPELTAESLDETTAFWEECLVEEEQDASTAVDQKEETRVAWGIHLVEQVATEEGVVDAGETEDEPQEEEQQQLSLIPTDVEALVLPDVDQTEQQLPSTPVAVSAPPSARKASSAKPTTAGGKSNVTVRLGREAQLSPWTPAVSSSLTAQKALSARPSVSAKKSAISVRPAREAQQPPSTPAAVSPYVTSRKAPAATPSTTARKSAISVQLAREAQQAHSTPVAVSTPLTSRKASAAASAAKSAISVRLAREAQLPPSTPAVVSASLTARKVSASTPSTVARKSAVSFALARETQHAPSTPVVVSASLTARKASAATPSTATTARKSAVSFGLDRLYATPVQTEVQSKERTCDRTRPSARGAAATGSRSMTSRVRTVSKMSTPMAPQEPEVEQEHAAENMDEVAVEKSLFSEVVAADEPLLDAELPASAEVVEADAYVVADQEEEEIAVDSVYTEQLAGEDDGVVMDDATEFEDALEEEVQLPSPLNEEEEDIGADLGSLFKTPALKSKAVEEHLPSTPAAVSAPLTAAKEEGIGSAIGSLFKTPAWSSKVVREQQLPSTPAAVSVPLTAAKEEDIGSALGSLFKTPAWSSNIVREQQLPSTPAAISVPLTATKASAAKSSSSAVRRSAVSCRLAGEAEKQVFTPVSAKAQPFPSSTEAKSTAASARSSGVSMIEGIEALPIAEDLEFNAAEEELIDGAVAEASEVQPAASFLANDNEETLESKEEEACELEQVSDSTAVDESVDRNDEPAARDFWEEFVLLKEAEAEAECFSESFSGNETTEGTWEAIGDADEEEEELGGEDEFFHLSEDLELDLGAFGSTPCKFNTQAQPVWWNAEIDEVSELGAQSVLRIAREVEEEDEMTAAVVAKEEIAAAAVQSPAAAAVASPSPSVQQSLRRKSAATTAKKAKKVSLTDDKENSVALLFANANNDNAEEAAAAGATDGDEMQVADNKLQEGGKNKKKYELPTQEELMAMSMRQLKKQFAALDLGKKKAGAAATLADAARECPSTVEKKKNNKSSLGRSALCPLNDNLMSPRTKC